MRRTLWTVVVVATLASACAGTSEPAAVWDGPPPDIYMTGGPKFASGCVRCHTLDGTDQPPPEGPATPGVSPTQGPSMLGISERAEDRVEGLSAADYIRQSIVDPGAHLVEGYDDVMPRVIGQRLSEEEVDELVDFLLAQ